MTLKCDADGCLSLHPTPFSLAMHQVNSGGDAHEEYVDFDETLAYIHSHEAEFIVDLEDGGEDPDGTPEVPDEGVPQKDLDGSAPEDGVADDPVGTDPVDTDAAEIEPAAATDGGQAPPEPEIPEPTVPEHFVPVEEFVDGAEAELPSDLVESEEWSAFREDILSGDEEYVDVAASDIAGGEVETADV